MARLAIFSETKVQQFRVEACCNCGVEFAMTEYFYSERLGDKKSFYCPNGHSQSYTGASYQKQIAQLEADKIALRSRVESERQATATAERKAARAKAEAKRMEKRAAASLCPYCNRSFVTVRMQKHIHTKHPDKAHGKQ